MGFPGSQVRSRNIDQLASNLVPNFQKAFPRPGILMPPFHLKILFSLPGEKPFVTSSHAVEIQVLVVKQEDLIAGGSDDIALRGSGMTSRLEIRHVNLAWGK
jgi:hypothetical protein